MSATWWCDKCQEEHPGRCPVNNDKRREQLRRAQAKHRAKRKAEREASQAAKDAAEIKRLKQKCNELIVQVRHLKAKLAEGGHGTGDFSFADFLGTKDRTVQAAWKATMTIVHPDRHGGHPEATRLAKLANEARDRLR